MGIREHWLTAAGWEESLLVDDVIVWRAADETLVNDLT
jgi:hypothetical protein